MADSNSGGVAGGSTLATEGTLERVCRFLCFLSFIVMVLVVGVEIVSRSLFGFSFQISDEMAGYMLVCLAFFSLAVTQANDGFHRVEFVQTLLPPQAQLGSRILFDVVTLLFAAFLFWVFLRLVNSSYRFGTVAPTSLGTPLWIAQSAMVLGMFAFILSLLRSIFFNLRRLRQGSAMRSEDA